MELGRALSSKRSSAGAELIPSGLTERQALALALEESRRAAQAQERAQEQEDSSDDDSGSSGSEDESCAGARARKSRENAAKRKRQQAAAAAKSAGGQRKRARAADAAEPKTGTSSENSKASRTTQQKMDLGAGAGCSVSQADAQECALGRNRGESADSEHRRGDSCDRDRLAEGSKQSQDTRMKDVGSEGAGESGLEQQGQQQQQQPPVASLPSKLSGAGGMAAPAAGGPGQLDARTIAEMARKRREKFGTSQAKKQRDKAAAAKLRGAPSGGAPQKGQQQKAHVPKLELGSRPSLAELVESDLFPDTPRRCSSSKTATPASTPTLTSHPAAKQQQQSQQAQGDDLARPDSSAAAPAAAADPVASPVRTPSPVAGSPRSMQRSDTNDIDVSVGDMSASLKELCSMVKAEEAEEGSALGEATPRGSVAGGQEEPAMHEGSSEPHHPKQQQQQQQQRRKGPLAVRRSPGKPGRPPALTLQDSSEPAAPGAPQPGQKRSRGGNRAARSNGHKGCSRSARWASPLGSPVGTSARRLRSAVVEEFKHNGADAMDAFAWQPLTPSRQRASAVLQACGMLTRQDSLAASAMSSRASAGTDAGAAFVKAESPAHDMCRAGSAAPMSAAPKVDQMLSQPSVSTGINALRLRSMSLDMPNQLAACSGGDGGFTTPPSSPVQQHGTDPFVTPKPSTSIEFPTLTPPSGSTPVLATPAISLPASPAVDLNRNSAEEPARPNSDCAKPADVAPPKQATLPLWRKLRPLYLQEQQAAGAGPAGGPVERPAGLPQETPRVASAAQELCAAIKGRHGLEGRRLELSSSAAEEDPVGFFGVPVSKQAAAGLPYPGSRLGKGLAALYGGGAGVKSGGAPPGAAASFRHGCGSVMEPYCRARDAPVWKSGLMSRAGSAGSCSNNPHLARQRAQRNLQNTWDDLLARQALETATAEAMVAWTQPSTEA